eukprot:SAG31_NODE_1733_length_7417_cov_1.994397_8_plen_95_part_00
MESNHWLLCKLIVFHGIVISVCNWLGALVWQHLAACLHCAEHRFGCFFHCRLPTVEAVDLQPPKSQIFACSSPKRTCRHMDSARYAAFYHVTTL